MVTLGTEIQTWQRDGYEISTDPARVDRDLTHRFLSEDAYGAGVSRDVDKAIDGSLVFGIYQGTEQVGYARVVSDYATFAWLCDVFVLPGHRLWLREVAHGVVTATHSRDCAASCSPPAMPMACTRSMGSRRWRQIEFMEKRAPTP